MATDNNNDPQEQMNNIVNGAFQRSDYNMLYDFAERTLVTLQAMKGYERNGYHNLTGININRLIIDASEILTHVECPYDDLDDTAFPEDDL